MKLLPILLIIALTGCAQKSKWDQWEREIKERHRQDSIEYTHWEDSIKAVGYRIWCLSEMGIHANAGYPVGKRLQKLIDSALALPGLTDIGFDEPGNYCVSDVKYIWWGRNEKDIGYPRMYFCAVNGSITGNCDTTKPKKAF